MGGLGGSFCTACTRRLKTPTLLVGEGTCLVWHICASESRLQTAKMPNMASSYLTGGYLDPVWVACAQCACSAETPSNTEAFGMCFELFWSVLCPCVCCAHTALGMETTDDDASGHRAGCAWYTQRRLSTSLVQLVRSTLPCTHRGASPTDQRAIRCLGWVPAAFGSVWSTPLCACCVRAPLEGKYPQRCHLVPGMSTLGMRNADLPPAWSPFLSARHAGRVLDKAANQRPLGTYLNQNDIRQPRQAHVPTNVGVYLARVMGGS